MELHELKTILKAVKTIKDELDDMERSINAIEFQQVFHESDCDDDEIDTIKDSMDEITDSIDKIEELIKQEIQRVDPLANENQLRLFE